MTGKEAIIHYLGTHKNFCAQDVAAVTGATVTSINQAAAKMARAGILVVDGKVWRTVYYRFATREEREGKVSTNMIFKECRQSAAMKRVLSVYRNLASKAYCFRQEAIEMTLWYRLYPPPSAKFRNTRCCCR